VSDTDTVLVDSLKALDPDQPIREADINRTENWAEAEYPKVSFTRIIAACQALQNLNIRKNSARRSQEA
jgi:hypothetical protein